MLIVRTVADMRKWRKNLKGSLGFIPTMGYLHEGHMSLVKLAESQNDHVIVSIFVNPKQFGPHENFDSYPRDEEHDLKLLNEAKVDVVFLPEAIEIYPFDFETQVSVSNLSKELEGKRRPGHFDGVATIITKFFNIIYPSSAYFGQKDAQQVLVIKKMVKDLQFPVQVVTGETIRQNNGLALSSRNKFLNQKQIDESAVIFKSLKLAQNLVHNGERNPKIIKGAMKRFITKTSGKIDYISIADPVTLYELTTVKKDALISLAVYFDKTRLIDNCMITL